MQDGNITTIVRSLTTSVDLNGDICKEILTEIFDINQLTSLINCKKITEIILLNHIILDQQPTKNPEKIELPNANGQSWQIEFERTLTKHKILLSKTDYERIISFDSKLKKIIETHKQINRITDNYRKKLNEEIESENNNVWTTMIEWIERKFIAIISNDAINPDIDFMVNNLNEYAKKSLEKLKNNLNDEIKDYLQSQVNKEIILSNKEKSKEWKEELKEQLNKNNPLIQSIENDIHNKLKDITNPFDTPFIKTFYNELFTRCYKKLLTPEKEALENSTVQEKTSFDINNQQIRKIKDLPSETEEYLDELLLEFLNYVCKNETNIKKYTKTNTKKFSTVLKNENLTEKQKNKLKSIYLNTYKSIRHYEKNIEYTQEKLESIDMTSNINIIKEVSNIIEFIYHEYKPFILELNDRMKVALTKNDIKKRRELISEHDEQVEKIRNISKIIEICRVIDKIIIKKNDEVTETINNSEPLKQAINNNNWKTFFSVWTNQDNAILEWLDLITKEVKINIDIPVRQSRKPLKNQEIIHPKMSTLIEKTPKDPNIDSLTVNRKL